MPGDKSDNSHTEFWGNRHATKWWTLFFCCFSPLFWRFITYYDYALDHLRFSMFVFVWWSVLLTLLRQFFLLSLSLHFIFSGRMLFPLLFYRNDEEICVVDAPLLIYLCTAISIGLSLHVHWLLCYWPTVATCHGIPIAACKTASLKRHDNTINGTIYINIYTIAHLTALKIVWCI